MCDVLQIARSTFYYEAKEESKEDDVTTSIVDIFHKNRKAYGTRKIKTKLHERGLVVSRRRIGRIMNERGLVSTYTVAQYKPNKAACNEAAIANTLNREFSQTEAKRFVVSDLTYVKVQNQCTIFACSLICLIERSSAIVQVPIRTLYWFPAPLRR